MLETLRRLAGRDGVRLALAPVTVGIAVFGAGIPAAKAGFSIVVDGGNAYIRVGQPYPLPVQSYPGYAPRQIFVDPVTGLPYSSGYYPNRQRAFIRNSTLINPTLIDSTIRNSTLINPIIIDSPERRTTRVRRSHRVRGVLPEHL